MIELSNRKTFALGWLVRRAVTVAIAVGAASWSFAPLPANAAPRQPCAFQAYGYIGDAWLRLGGASGPLQCPWPPYEQNVPGRRGKVMTFVSGEIVWSPDQGSAMTVAAYERGGRIWVDWGSTSQFHYDKFIIRWHRNGRFIQQDTVRSTDRRKGVWSIPSQGPGRYTVIVEGCDNSGWNSSTCRQGWTIPVGVNARY